MDFKLTAGLRCDRMLLQNNQFGLFEFVIYIQNRSVQYEKDKSDMHHWPRQRE